MVKPVALALALTSSATAMAAPPANDEDPRAAEARSACAMGDVDRGIRLLAYLTAVDDPAIIYNMGRCYEQNGLVDQAALRFEEYLRKARDVSADDRREAEEHIRALRAEHDRRTRSTQARASSGSLVLSRLGLTLGAVGVVALGASGVFALSVKSANEDLATLRKEPFPNGDHYTSRMGDGRRAETREWISLGVAGAAVAAGAILYILGWTPSSERGVALGGWMTSEGGSIRVSY